MTMPVMWVLLVTLVALQGGGEQTPSASVSGAVVRLGTNVPMAGVYVELSRYELAQGGSAPQAVAPSTSQSVFNMTTGEDGRFVFRGVPGGRYRLVATLTGTTFAPIEYGQRDPRGKGVPIVLGPDQHLENVELGMATTGSISGLIFDSDGQPVANARVMALEARYRDGERVLSIVQAVRSNDLGEYRLFWLRAGRYYIAAKREDQRNFSFSVHVAAPEAAGFREDASSPVVTQRTLDDGRTIEETDVVVYFGGGTDPQRAQPVDLDSAAGLSAVDIRIVDEKVRTYRVSGVLVDARMNPTSLSQVRLIPRKPSAHMAIPNTTPNKQGEFILTGVMPGSYYLAAIVGGGSGFSFNESFWEIGEGTGALIPIEVGDADLQNVPLAMRPAYNMSGRIRVETGRARSDFNVSAARVSLVRDPDLLGLPQPSPRILEPNRLPSGVPSDEGIFTLSGFGTGDYRVQVHGIPETAYVKTIGYGTTDVLGSRLRVQDSPNAPLEIVVNLDGGSLEGVVRNERLQPVANAVIVLAPDVPSRGMHHLYKAAAGDNTGRFNIRGIAPGDYKVFAFDFIDSGAWLDPQVLQNFETRGTSLRIGAGASQEVELPLLPRTR